MRKLVSAALPAAVLIATPAFAEAPPRSSDDLETRVHRFEREADQSGPLPIGVSGFTLRGVVRF